MAVARWTLAGRVVAAACAMACDGADEAPPEETTPILDLPPRIAQSCDVASPTTVISDGLDHGYSLVATDGRYRVFTYRSETVGLSELTVDPLALAPPFWTQAAPDASGGGSATARDEGGVVVAWSEIDVAETITRRVAVAGIDAEGAALGSPSYFTFESDSAIGGIALASRQGGFALAWSHLEELYLVLLDGDGVPTTEPMVVASGAQFASHMARHGDGLALGLIAFDDEGETDVRLLLLDSDGVPRAEPLHVPTRRDRRHRRPFVISSGADVLLAWEEGYFPPQHEGDVPTGHTIVRIARITDGGELAGPVLRVQESETGIVNVNPTLLPVEGAVALSWSRGHMRPICGGCVTDNVMQFFLLDSEDLAPVSDVVEVGGPSGLTSAPITTFDGESFAYLLYVDYHARFDLAAAMVHCEPGP